MGHMCQAVQRIRSWDCDKIRGTVPGLEALALESPGEKFLELKDPSHAHPFLSQS